jgi:hypothetical protein
LEGLLVPRKVEREREKRFFIKKCFIPSPPEYTKKKQQHTRTTQKIIKKIKRQPATGVGWEWGCDSERGRDTHTHTKKKNANEIDQKSVAWKLRFSFFSLPFFIYK